VRWLVDACAVRAVHDRFRFHVAATVFQLEELPPKVWPLAITLSRRHSAKLGTRMPDVLRVASALILKPDVFLTFNERQRKLARAEACDCFRRPVESADLSCRCLLLRSAFPSFFSADRPVPPALPSCDPADSRPSTP
jgi:hypothetical protein